MSRYIHMNVYQKISSYIHEYSNRMRFGLLTKSTDLGI